MNNTNKQRVFSGVKPSGNLHLGNYLGALKQWVSMQDEYECIFSVVDYHAITVPQDPSELNKQIIDIARVYLASGINTDKSVIFKQSDISAHTELAWILNCIARVADLDKMTQFKDKGGENRETVSVGLYDYPVLMAADILLYDTRVVPVGDDQLQHLELTRTLARRFNNRYKKDIFTIPEARIMKSGARIMGLDDPAKKMSKSASSQLNYIALDDSEEMVRKKISKAVTDSEGVVRYDTDNKPAISNLLHIYSLLSGQSIEELESKYEGKGYGDFKSGLADTVVDFLIDFQDKYNTISDDEVRKILEDGANHVEKIAKAKLHEVKQVIGLV